MLKKLELLMKEVARSQVKVVGSQSAFQFLHACLQKHAPTSIAAKIIHIYHAQNKSNMQASNMLVIFLFHISSSPQEALLGAPVESFPFRSSQWAPTEGLIHKQQRRHLAWTVTAQTLMHLSVYVHSLSILTHAVYFIINLNC